jgi:DNA-binding response OmpR family regulator
MAKRILIAEDNQTLAASLTQLLRRRSFEVIHHADGISALRAIASAPPDLLLLDLHLPGMNGVQLLKKLRLSPHTARLPVIILSGVYRGSKYHQAARTLGVDHYIEKPFKAGQVLAAIETLLGPTAEPARPVFRYLQDAFHKRFSGQLVLAWPDTRRTLVFLKGAPISLRPGFAYRNFGAYLRANNLISTAEYDYYANTAGFRQESLVELGCLTHPDLLQAKLDYLRTEMETAFGAPPPAEASWQDLAVPDLLQVITLNVPDLFYRGFRRFPGPAAKRVLARFIGQYPAPADNYYRHINFLELTGDDKQCLHRMDGQSTLANCIVEGIDPAPLLLTLLSLNMLKFSPEPNAPAAVAPGQLRALFNAFDDETESVFPETLESFIDLVDEDAADPAGQSAAAATPEPQSPATAKQASAAADLSQTVTFMAQSLTNKNHYEVFGIKPSRFSIDLLKERYFAVTRQFGPEVLMQLGGAEAAMVETILSTVATAYDTLSDVVKKERYDELLGSGKVGLGQAGDDRFQAQVQEESGKVFIEMEEWDNAEKSLQEAVGFDPNSGEALAHLAWAIYRNPRHAESQAMQNKARQMINKSLTLQRTAQGFAYKGWMLLDNNQELMAESEFSKALKLDARNAMARTGLRTLREKQEQNKKGLFKRIFR